VLDSLNILASIAVSKALNNPGFNGSAYSSPYSTVTPKSNAFGKKTESAYSSRPHTANHGHKNSGFNIGYKRETGLVSTQMQSNQEITKSSAPENHSQMKSMHDRYRNRQGKTTFNLGSKLFRLKIVNLDKSASVQNTKISKAAEMSK